MQAGLAEQYVALCESSDSPPDLFAFLEHHSDSDARRAKKLRRPLNAGDSCTSEI